MVLTFNSLSLSSLFSVSNCFKVFTNPRKNKYSRIASSSAVIPLAILNESRDQLRVKRLLGMDQTATSWTCDFCSVVNRGSKCSSCGVLKSYESPRRSPSAGRKQHRRQSNNDSSTVILADSKSSEQTVKWTCTLCSYKNWPNATKCVMCNSRRNAACSSSRNSACSSIASEDVRGAVGGPSNIDLSSCEEQRKWKCTTCTYENWPRTTKCTLCCTLKPLSPPLSPLGSTTGSISGGLYQEVSGVGQPGDLTELQSRIQSLSASDKIKQIRNKMNETDWLFLNACMGVVNNDFAAVQSYLQATAGEPL